VTDAGRSSFALSLPDPARRLVPTRPRLRGRGGRGRLVSALNLIKGREQSGNTRGRGLPVRESLKIIDQPVERHLQGHERGRCLSELAERHGAVEVFRGTQDPCECRREQQIHLRDHRRSHELPEQLSPPIEDLMQG
jgi:hypothetical protein